MSALRLINETSGAGVTTVSVTDVFNTDFDIYKIVIDDYDKNDTSFEDCTFRFINASGSVVTASNYDYGYLAGRSWTIFVEGRNTNQTLVPGIGGDDQQGGNGTVIYVFNPYSSSSYSFILWQGNGFDVGNGYVSYKGIAVLKQTASMSGFQIFGFSQAQNINASIRTYGLRVDNG